MRKQSQQNIKHSKVFIITMVLITSILGSSCSVTKLPEENQIPVDPTVLTVPSMSDQAVVSEEENKVETADSTDRDGSETVDVNVTDYPIDEVNEAIEFNAAKDMQLGLLIADMPKIEVERVMKSELVETDIKNEYGMETEILSYEDGTVIHLLDGKLYSISVRSPEYATPRGLKTGDSAETLRQLYGEPTTIEDDKWIYSSRGYDFFFVTVQDGEVVEIMISQVL